MGFLSGIGSGLKGGLGFVSKLPIVGDIAGDLLGSVGSAYGANELINKPNAELAYEQSKEAATTAWERSKEGASTAFMRELYSAQQAHKRNLIAYRQRFQTTMNDMRKAGLNPILAAGSGGFNVGQTPVAPMASAVAARAEKARGFKPDVPVDYLSTGREKTASAKESLENVYLIRAKKGVATQEERKLVEEIYNIQRTYLKIGAEISQLTENIRKIKAQRDYTQADTIKVENENKLITLKRKELKKIIDKLKFNLKRLHTLDPMYDRPTGRYIREFNETLRGLFGKVPGY
jgi:hypothetical protein